MPIEGTHYAMKVMRTGRRPEWRSGLTFAAAVARAAALLEAAERESAPHYLTVTIYENAMTVATFRYYPAAMRRKEASPHSAFVSNDSPE